MRFTASTPARRVALSVTLGAALLSATGCGYINDQQTTRMYSASDGAREDLGPLQLRNVLIVSSGIEGASPELTPDAPGRLIGTVFNTSDKPVSLTFSDGGSTVRLDVPADGELRLEEESTPVELSQSGAIPGGLSPITFTANGQTKEIGVPVLDGTLPEYRDYLPSQAATPTPTSGSGSTSTATPSPASGAGH
ncbi:hypothetical protein [Sinomonas mesophila]|uniref:hypothetical protein n=1 Tax=Sinomonas mesophila TaxID=1531955 RepID=UPI000985FA61|nr:hypothetical protein [Sinomonas mesophila]